MAIKKTRRKFTILIPESMAPKSDNTKKSVAKNTVAGNKVDVKKNATSPVDEDLDDDALDELDEEVIPKTSKSKSAPKSKKAKADDEEDDDADIEEETADDWEKTEEDENWDPDFDEFDIPKSGAKKVGKKKPGDEDDLKIDEDFKEFGLFDDMDGGGGTGFDDDDDF
ncbi:MAG: hypothetical protein ABIW38_10940 [Ferruginibacter sp.]